MRPGDDQLRGDDWTDAPLVEQLWCERDCLGERDPVGGGHVVLDP